MSIPNSLPNYNTLASILGQQGVALTPAEMHGLLSGIICGGSQGAGWKTLLHELTNDGMAFSQTLSQPLEKLHESISCTLEEEGFFFQLLLPDDDSTIFERVDALAGWVNHFLLGLGVMQPELDKVTGDTGEAIDDLRTIAKLGYDEDEDQEMLARSFEEVMEYVRVVVLLCHDSFTTAAPVATASEVKKPTLH